MDAIAGWKTHIFSALAIGASIMAGVGWIDQQTLMTLLGVFGGGAAMSLRSAVKKVETKTEAVGEEVWQAKEQVRSFMSVPPGASPPSPAWKPERHRGEK